jgi:hypothetical protein
MKGRVEIADNSDLRNELAIQILAMSGALEALGSPTVIYGVV